MLPPPTYVSPTRMRSDLIVDFLSDGRVLVSTCRDGEGQETPAGDPFPLEWPADDGMLGDLRWYLEDYLRVPYGVYQQKGPRIASSLDGWGEAIFNSLFANESAREAYAWARASAGHHTNIVLRSNSAAPFALPWELMRDATRARPLALDGIQLTRSISATYTREPLDVGGKRLRVLLVISRPSGQSDIDYRLIGRPMLERLDAMSGPVEVIVLRPPTRNALQQALADGIASDEPFQIVHFDGHGLSSRASSDARRTQNMSGGEAVLLFEAARRGSRPARHSQRLSISRRRQEA
jgi:hypothetical protein